DFHVTGVQTCALPICMRCIKDAAQRLGVQLVNVEKMSDCHGAWAIPNVAGKARCQPAALATRESARDIRSTASARSSSEILSGRSEERRVGKEWRARW